MNKTAKTSKTPKDSVLEPTAETPRLLVGTGFSADGIAAVIKDGKAPKSAKAKKPAKTAKADKEADGEASDRLPTTLAELKEGKGGLVSYLYLTGIDRDAIVAKVREAFKVTEAQAFKIARRHIGRTRLYVRILEVLVKDRPTAK